MRRIEKERMFDNLSQENGISREEYYLAYKKVKTH